MCEIVRTALIKKGMELNEDQINIFNLDCPGSDETSRICAGNVGSHYMN